MPEKKEEKEKKVESKEVKKETEEKKESKKEEKIEKAAPALPETRPAEGKVFTIPLRKAFRKSEKKRKNYAISIIRDFLARHTKADDVKIGSELHKAVWDKGNPPRRLRIKAVMDGSVVKAELLGFEYKEFKALPKQEKKGVKEKLLGRLGPKAAKKEEEEKMIKEKIKPEKPLKEEQQKMLEE
jgi:large subunit ribosomal protein L31e